MTISIDLGSSNLIVACDMEVIIYEPSVITFDDESNEVIAIGNNAMEFCEKDFRKFKTCFAVKNIVLTDLSIAKSFFPFLFETIKFRTGAFNFDCNIRLAIPAGISEGKKQKLTEIIMQAGASSAKLIYEPLAIAVSSGINIETTEAVMILDVGGEQTDIAIIGKGKIINTCKVPGGGVKITSDIQDYLRIQYNILLSFKEVEKIKQKFGLKSSLIDNRPEEYIITSSNPLNERSQRLPVSYDEILHCLYKSITEIENALITMLKKSNPLIYNALLENKIILTGGGSMLCGFAENIEQAAKLKVRSAPEPLYSVIIGLLKYNR